MPIPEIDALNDALTPIDVDHLTALGWLYALKSSNIGAAFLFKFAQKIGLSEHHGASHLAGSPEGRGKHWRVFRERLNELPLSDDEQAKALTEAKDAFAFVHAQIEKFLP